MYVGSLGQDTSDFQTKAAYVAALATEYNTAVRDFMAVFPSATRSLITNLQVFPMEGYDGVRFTFTLGDASFQLYSIADFEGMVNDVKAIDAGARTKTAEQYAALANAGTTINLEAPQVDTVPVTIQNYLDPAFGPVPPGAVTLNPQMPNSPSGPAPVPSGIIPDYTLPRPVETGGIDGMALVLVGLLALMILRK